MANKNRFALIEGITDVKSGEEFHLSVEGAELLLDNVKVGWTRFHSVQLYRLPLENVIKADIVQHPVIVDKSVVGRGVLGALLFGEEGATIGAMSGLGTKQKTKRALVIGYLSLEAPKEPRYIALEMDKLGPPGFNDKYVAELKAILEQVEPAPMVQEHLAYVGRNKRADGSIGL